jgi:mRNA interferase RelE/StbE
VPYDVTFATAAAKSLEGLDRGLLRRIKSKIEKLAENPRLSGSIKLSGHADLYRVRVGDYRVVFRIDDAAKTIEIAIVADRKVVYRDL